MVLVVGQMVKECWFLVHVGFGLRRREPGVE